MLNKIIAFSLRNRALVVLATLILIIGGCWTAKNMEVDVFPDLNAPTVVIMTEAKGMAAEEVERLVTFPIETAVNGATDVRRVRSSSTMGFSVVWVEFDWDTDIYRDRQIVSEKLSTIADAMPEGVGTQGRRITLWHQFSKERTVPSCSLSFCLHAALSFILFYPC